MTATVATTATNNAGVSPSDAPDAAPIARLAIPATRPNPSAHQRLIAYPNAQAAKTRSATVIVASLCRPGLAKALLGFLSETVVVAAAAFFVRI